MKKGKISICILVLGALNSCKTEKEDEKIKVEPPQIHILSNMHSKVFIPQKNPDGSYSPFQGEWLVPEHVTSVKIIGCSGGNGGGGGGAGGAGAKFFSGNWSGASMGGDGSAGGGANGNNLGQNGEAGLLGRYKDDNGPWFAASSNSGGYQRAGSASQNGEAGAEGEATVFGQRTFLKASLNKNNENNVLKIKTKFSDFQVCLGGVGGSGGRGGVGGYAEVNNVIGANVRYFQGGIGGKGGNGTTGFHSLVEEYSIAVTPGAKIPIYVGVGGKAGSGSKQTMFGQEGGGFGTNGGNGTPGSHGQNGSPGVLYIEWIGK